MPRGKPACRWSSTLARPKTTPPRFCRQRVREGGVTGVLHCFTGSAELARKGLDLGFYVSLSGIVTFKNAQDLQETAKWLPADQMLVETDSPFLAPVPHRGQKCEPAFVADTAALRCRVAR